MKLKPDSLKVAFLQLNTEVGNTMGNMALHAKAYHEAVASGAELVVAMELGISGYPPKDDLLHKSFINRCKAAAECLAAEVGDVPLAFGTPWPVEAEGDYGQKAYNRFVVAHKGEIVFFTDKVFPAQGGVFDEWRVHKPGIPKLWSYRGLRIGFPICEDIWHDSVVDILVKAGAEVLLVPNGSPGYIGKPLVREQIVARHVKRTGIPMFYLNHVGGQDEHAFEGGAFYMNPDDKRMTVVTPFWEEATAMVDIVRDTTKTRFRLPADAPVFLVPGHTDFVLDAIVNTMLNYIIKSSPLRKVVIGISGGVDSAIVLGLAVLMMRKLGLDPARHIIAVSLPTRHNSGTTRGFAQQVCDNFGIPLYWWPIEDAVAGFTASFESVFNVPFRVPGNVAYENAQSRERGQALMAIANYFGAIVLSTGNKSEMAMGFATLYGDMNGGYNPLKTLYKTQAYILGETINERMGFEAIPIDLIDQPPSAELDENQLDANRLPVYPVLDTILTQFMDEGCEIAEMIGNTYSLAHMPWVHVHVVPADHDMWTDAVMARSLMLRYIAAPTNGSKVDDHYYVHPDSAVAIIRNLFAMRYKRYQGPPGATVTKKGFDDGDNYPIANHTDWVADGVDQPHRLERAA